MSGIPNPVLTDRFLQAMTFASIVHAGQVRKGTSIPYLAHLMSVAALVLEHEGDEDTAIAALLHDAPEDQGGRAMLVQIKARFGDRVEQIVEGCTDTFEDPKPEWAPRKLAYVEHLRHADRAVCLVTGADKLHNARAILHDLRNVGSEVFCRFNASEAQLGWYYASVARVLHGRLEGTNAGPLATTLGCVIDEIAAFEGRRAFGLGVQAGRRNGQGDAPPAPHPTEGLDPASATCPCQCDDAEVADKVSRVVLHRPVDTSHFSMTVTKCTSCGQHFLSVFMELVDWAGGDDSMSTVRIPLTPREAATAREFSSAGEAETALRKANLARRKLWWASAREGEPSAFWDDGPLRIMPHD